MEFGLKGKGAIVTGGSLGIGRAIALELAREGVSVAVNYRRHDAEARSLVEEIERLGCKGLAVKADVASFVEAEAMLKQAVEAFGRLEILVCNAGITWDGPIWKMTEQQWDAVIGTNLKGYFNYNRAAAIVFKEQKYGKIVNISSINGMRGKFAQANYAAAKGGEIALTKTLAKELGRFNVNVNAIAPGMVLTDLMKDIAPEFLKKALDETVLGRFATPEDVARLVAFLCSDASRHVTGEVIKIDGGQYMFAVQEDQSMSRVGVIGIGHGKFGRRSDATVQELAFEAFRAAVKDASISPKEIEASVIGAVPEYHKQRSVAGVVQEYLNLNPGPTWLTEVACASGSAALRTAWMAIQSGLHRVVAVIGCQKMTELSTAEILALMGRVGEVQWESVFGATFPAYYALFAARHMHEFGTTHQQMLQVAVKNHHYGSKNPNAMFQKEITLEKALASEAVASPFCVYDCCANADGAACLILAEESRAKAVGDRVVWLDGLGCATASMSVLRRPDLVGLPSAAEAARQAYQMAGVGARDVQVADVHDCFTIAEIMAYEDLGFCKKGEGGRYIEEKRAYIGGGATAVNLDGGLKAKGHPIGATGVSMAYEIVTQLRGEAGARQVPGATLGLTHNVGGIGQYTFVNVFRRD